MTKTDLLLINPSARKKVYQDSQEQADYPAIEPPYLALLTAEFIRNRKFDVKIIDANAENLSGQEVSERVKDYSPKLVHIIVQGNQPSASTHLMDNVKELCNAIKQNNPNLHILLSGVHPSALPRKTLLEEKCDFVLRGDGFHSVLDLLQDKPFSDILGLWYKKNGNIFVNHFALMNSEEIGNTLIKGAWDLLLMSQYRAHDWHCLENLDDRQPYASIYTSFGCPMNCNFCCINAPFNDGGQVRNRLRFRNPQKVVDEIQMLHEQYGIKHLKIADEMFIFDRNHYLAIAREIIKRRLGGKLNIWAYARVDTVKEKDLETLKKAGFNWLCLGIESGNQQVRQNASKGKFGQEDIRKVVKQIESHGIYTLGNYMFGLPDDTLETMQETFNLAVELNCTRPNFYCVIPYPGSQLHSLAEQRKLELPPEWDKSKPLLPEEKKGFGWKGYSQHSEWFMPLPTSTLYPEEVLKFRDDAVKYYFSDKNLRYKQKLVNLFGRQATERFFRMNSISFKRKILENKD